MKASELRIGNLIFDLTMSPVQVRGTGTSCIWISENGPGTELAFTPIPLTEEWLVKFGFKGINKPNSHYVINDPNGYKDTHKISIFLTLNSQWQIAFSDELAGYKDYIPTTKIEYVHQLQNLYFALTGEELTIKAESAK